MKYEMTGLRSLSCGVTLFILLPIYVHAVSLKFTNKPGPLTYVRLGDTLRLDVSYDFDGTNDVVVSWLFGTVAKIQKIGNNPPQIGDSRATLEGEASLVLKNTTLKDNITFTVKITSFGASDIESSSQVIVTAVSLKFTNKSGSLTYVRLGDTLRLDVSYDFDGTNDVIVAWLFGTVAKIQKIGKNPPQIGDPRATIEGEASLVLKNTTLKDNITFTVKITSFGASDIESFFQVIVTAVSLKFTAKPGPLTYVRLGDTLRLNVSYDFDGTNDVTVSWLFGVVATVQKVGNNPPQSADPRATLEGQASLVLKNTTLKDNITFTVKITSFGASDIESSSQVIVTVNPDALTDCSQMIEVNKGESVACRCYSTKGNPTPTASWYKDGTLIGGVGYSETPLSLNNIMIKDNGTYTCQLQSYDLKNETSVHVFVKFAPESVEISSNKKNNIATLGQDVIIKCVSNAYPAPTYTIVLNGTKQLTGVVDGEKTIKEATYEDAGRYTCVAENNLGNASNSFTLHVQEKIITAKPGNSGTEWYLGSITLICGIIVGMVSQIIA